MWQNSWLKYLYYPFAWQLMFTIGANQYWENSVTGERRVKQEDYDTAGLIDYEWLEANL
jgi:hypothetical protein